MIKIHKEVYGHGKTIVLIHGWAMHTGIWRTFAQQLAQHYQVICLDLPGHGLSETVEPYTLEKIGKSLIEVLPKSPFCLLGWSLGASVALLMAKKYPDQIDSLIILSGNPRFIREKGWAGMRIELLEGFAKNMQQNCKLTLIRFLTLQVYGLPDGRGVLSELKQALLESDAPDQSVLQGGLGILKQADLRDCFTSLTCPIKIIQGEKDTLVPVQACLDMKEIRPACEVNIIPDAGHLPFVSHSSQVIEAITNFL